MQYKSTGCQITTVDKTTDKLTGRGGLSFILRYLEKIKFFNLAAETLPAKCAQKWSSFKNMNYQDAEFYFFCWSNTQTSRQYQVSLKIKATSPLFFWSL